MNENNVDYLIKQVKFTGFGDSLEFKIRENVAKGQDSFQLSHKPEFGNDRAEATLNFRKSDQGNYFFNSYDLKVKPQGGDELNQNFKVSGAKAVTLKDAEGKPQLDGEGKEQKEWVNNTFTLKEAFNMMDANQKGEGRAVLKDFVNKQDEKHTFWNKLDFANRDQYGNYETRTFLAYDLEAKLKQFPIKELGSDENKKQLIESLERGNRQSVTMTGADGTEYKRSLEANPQFKTINMFDGNQRVKHQSVKQADGQSQSESKEASQKNNTKKSPTDEGDDGPPQQAEASKKKRGRKVA